MADYNEISRGNPMKTTTAIPGALVGLTGLVVGVLSLVLESPTLGAIAGICAGCAAWWLVIMNRKIIESQSRQALITNELEDVKAQTAETSQAVNDLQNSGEVEKVTVDDDTNFKNDASSSEPETQGPDVLHDPSTGLFSENFFKVALETRIASARRHLRPISVVVLALADDAKLTVQETAAAIQETIRDADTACRLSSGEFALVLEDTPETGAVWTVERIRRNLQDASDKHATVWAGVACYPAHAFTRDEIIQASTEALKQAKEWDQDRIEVATTIE